MIDFIRITDENISTVQKLAKEIWEEHFVTMISKEQIDYMLDWMYSSEKIKSEIKSGIIWEIVYNDENPVGYLVYKLEEEKVFLSKIYLKNETRGKGFGKEMLERVKDYAKENQKNKIYLTVNKGNETALKFYERTGFILARTETTDIGNGYVMDDYILELSL